MIANDSARPGVSIGKLFDHKTAAKLMISSVGANPETQRQMIAGELEVELISQGTLAERIRCAGFGLGGILTACKHDPKIYANTRKGPKLISTPYDMHRVYFGMCLQREP